MERTDGKLGIALVGLGSYSASQLAPALQETQHCYLAGIVSGSAEKAASWKEQYGLADECIYDYNSFDSIVDNPAIDIVYIVLPNALHAQYVIRAAAAGKHVICEKPMATTVEDALSMIDACSKAGVSLSIGYRLHFEPYNQEMMRLGNTQKYGPVQKLTARDGLEDVSGWRLKKALAGGGALMDVGIYCVQAANYVMNMTPIAVTAEEGKKTKPQDFTEVEESMAFQLEYSGGYIAYCACSYTQVMDELHAEASNGFFSLQPAFAYEGIKGKASYGEMAFEAINQQAAQMDAIAAAIKAHKPSPVPGETGLQDIKIIAALYTAMRSGARVLVHY
ncbi:MAG TPA: Gfo/Idh/MocA family oxidoreductase [Chitinophagaceae bacterium]|nr:Gfo/Idh/MocA family oxidoreductase [Chitinophagaceae bacterium]